MSLEESLRAIVREELAEALHGLRRPRRELLNIDELGEALGVSRSTVKRMVDAGCPHDRIGELPRFRLPEVLDWLRARRPS